VVDGEISVINDSLAKEEKTSIEAHTDTFSTQANLLTRAKSNYLYQANFIRAIAR
jgi:hypothetical protein